MQELQRYFFVNNVSRFTTDPVQCFSLKKIKSYGMYGLIEAIKWDPPPWDLPLGNHQSSHIIHSSPLAPCIRTYIYIPHNINHFLRLPSFNSIIFHQLITSNQEEHHHISSAQQWSSSWGKQFSSLVQLAFLLKVRSDPRLLYVSIVISFFNSIMSGIEIEFEHYIKC